MTILYCPFRTLVSGNNNKSNEKKEERQQQYQVYPLIVSDVPLSFWGGVDPLTGIVIDTNHPLHGICITDTILCLPGGRGSCTASQVLLELILNKKAPKSIVLRDRDGLLCVGALIAKDFFPESNVLDIIQVENNDFPELSEGSYRYGCVLSEIDSSLLAVSNSQEVLSTMLEEKRKFAIDDEKNETTTTTTTDSNAKTNVKNELSSQEKDMLDNAQTDAERRAVECIIEYAHILSENPTYIDVEKAHIDGCTYIGPGGLNFVQRLLQDGGSVKIPTTLNSVSTDLRYWDRLNIIPTESQQASIKLAETYLALGCSERSFTCAPYLLNDPPKLNQQIVWGESNAVVFANTVLGARTEKYADYLDICCAIVGKVPEVGVHLEENRRPNILLDATNLDFETDDSEVFSLLFPVLGHLCGSLSDGDVPILVGLERYSEQINRDHMKSFCAAFGTTGGSPLIHVAGVTPEAKEAKVIDAMTNYCSRTVKISEEDLQITFETLDNQQGGTGSPNTEDDDDREEVKIDWIALGNPHLSLSECKELQDLVENLPPSHNKKKHKDVQIIACMSRVLYDQSPAIPALREFGIDFVQDTCWCMLLEPPMIPSSPNSNILTNSGKYAHYGPGLTGRNFRLGTMKDCIRAAVSGKLDRRTTVSSKFPWTSSSQSMQRRFHSFALHQHPLHGNWYNRRFPSCDKKDIIVANSHSVQTSKYRALKQCRTVLQRALSAVPRR